MQKMADAYKMELDKVKEYLGVAGKDSLKDDLAVLHRIVNCHTIADGTTRAVDVKADILVWILRLQKQQLCHDQVCCYIIHFLAQENNSLFEKTGINVIRTLSAVCLLHHIRY